MSGYNEIIKLLIRAEGKWETDVGATFPGVRVVYRGRDLLNELTDTSWMGLLLLGITGREFSEKQVKLFDTLWALAVSYPDPRLWNNRVAALAGTVRSTAGLASTGALSISEAKIYGGRVNVAAIDFIIKAKQLVDEGKDLSEIVKTELKSRRVVPGYGRPIVNRDERNKPLLKIVDELGFSKGQHLRLALEVEKILSEGRWRMKMNVTGLAAALGADQGLSVREYYHWCVNCFLAGIVPCFVDANTQPEGTFFPLSCERISYEGADNRKW